MSIVKWEGIATATSSIVHGSQVLGTITYLRREKFLLPDGSIEEIPVLSGNAWRGLLRDIAADIWWDRVGKPKLTLPVVHALWSGGALVKISGPVLTGLRLAALRKAVPVVGIFGTAGGGRIIDGCLQVGKMIPICIETVHLLPKEIINGIKLNSIWDITQIEHYSKVPSIDQDKVLERVTDEKMDPMRFGVETFIAGTQFYTWCSLTWPTEGELGFFREVLKDYSSRTIIGGMSRAGHGRINLDLNETINSVQKEDIDSWSKLEEYSDLELLEMLSWLD